MDILDILKKAAENQAADIFIVCGAVLSFKANGRMYELDGNALSPEDTKNLVLQIFHLAKRDITEEQLPEREKDFSLSVAGVGRFRVNIYKQRGSFSAVLRYVPFDLPDPAKLGIPEQVMQLSECKSGIVLITGVASSGKSTTLSCILDRLNPRIGGQVGFDHQFGGCVDRKYDLCRWIMRLAAWLAGLAARFRQTDNRVVDTKEGTCVLHVPSMRVFSGKR